jgi:hypothetical protein
MDLTSRELTGVVCGRESIPVETVKAGSLSGFRSVPLDSSRGWEPPECGRNRGHRPDMRLPSSR